MKESELKVCIAKDRNIKKAVIKSFDLMGETVDKNIKKYPAVLIKPNLCGGVPGERGSHTSVEVLRAVIEFFSSYHNQLYIGEADCSFNDARHVFNQLGIYQLAKEFRAEVINLSEGPYIDVTVPRALSIKVLRISTILTNCLIVSVPVLKTHPWSGITINLKNMYGAVYEREKARYHDGLENNIVDINKVIGPHLCIVDASTAIVRGGFKYGLWVGYPPTTMDIIITGCNPVSVDAVGAKILGKDPWSIGHIKIAAQLGLGTCDIQKLQIVGSDYEFG
ncbi:MAG: DUF362 domain-containing protein [Bacteroidia bacterium]|nr:DUF362 domain-containing protein [Bacteroidia bacterium]